MTLESALTYLCSNKLKQKELTDPFYLYSVLSDICNDTYENKEDVKTYWKVLSKVNIYEYLFNEDVSNVVKKIKALYDECSNEVSRFEYERMIEYTFNSLGYSYGKLKKKKKKTNELHGFDIKDGILYKYTGRKIKVTIPSCVKVIKSFAFYNNKKIRKIIIPDTVELIESYAFSYLDYAYIQLGYVGKIESYAFWQSDFVSIYLEAISYGREKEFYRRNSWDKKWDIIHEKFLFKKRAYTRFYSIEVIDEIFN